MSKCAAQFCYKLLLHVTMPFVGRPSTRGHALPTLKAWSMQAWLPFSTTMKQSCISSIRLLACVLFLSEFLSSFLIWGIGKKQGAVPDLEDLLPEREISSLNCSQLFRQQMLFLILWKRLGVIDGGLRSSPLATCLNLVFAHVSCPLPFAFLWICFGDIAKLFQESHFGSWRTRSC